MRTGIEAVAGSGATAGGKRPEAYRPHVDGLRAVSIVAVVAFHAGMPGFGGGFVGVDIFFVISGFLIIGQIVEALERGQFSAYDFYARRALRILPSYGAMLIATALAGILVLRAPADLEAFLQSAIYAPLFLTNFFFLLTSGYFDVGADLKPLLHTWSLAVEEQFYLVVPLLLVGLFVIAQRRNWRFAHVLGAAAAVIGMVSLAGCILLTPPDLDLWVSDRNPAFFMTWWRAWEFVAGGLVGAAAAGRWHGGSRLVATLLGLAGAAMVGLAITFVGLDLLGIRLGALDRVLSYPGYAATLPVAGAALVILSGLVNGATPVARLLSLGPLLCLGQISYALYLWHWPLLVYGRLLPFDLPRAVVDAGAVVLSVLLAIATRHLIELPILAWRRRVDLGHRRRLAMQIAFGTIPACIAVAIVSGAVVWPRYDQAVANPMTARIKAAEAWGSGPCVAMAIDEQMPCFEAGKPFGVLFGDSHAMATMSRFAFEAEQNGKQLLQMTAPGCNLLTFVKDLEASRNNAFCRDLAERMDRFLPKIDAAAAPFIVFDGYWTAMMGGNTEPDEEERFAEAYRSLLELFSDGGRRRMLVIGPLPNFERADPFNCVDLSSAVGLSLDRCGVSRAIEDDWRRRAMEVMRAVTAEFPQARLVDPIDIFCDDRICLPVKDGILAFRDDHHLNAFGAEAVYDAFRPDFEWAFKG